jgi:hypothetical protein
MHVFANVIKYLMAGQIKVTVDDQTININFKIFTALKADKFPDLEFFEIGSSVQRPTKRKTLFDNHLLHKITVEHDKLKEASLQIPDSELRETKKFVRIFEEMYQAFFFSNSEIFNFRHKRQMEKFRNYIKTLSFDNKMLLTNQDDLNGVVVSNADC